MAGSEPASGPGQAGVLVQAGGLIRAGWRWTGGRLASAGGQRLAGLALLCLALLLRLADPWPAERLRLLQFDQLQALHPRPASPDPVVLVAIDEASLAALGQWPWPRTAVADLIRHIEAAGPAAIGLDMIFPEPDRTSPPVLAREMRELPETLRAALAMLPDHDAILAAALAEAPVVLPRAPLDFPSLTPAPAPPPAGLALLGGDPRPFLPHLPGLLANLPGLEAAASGLATIAFLPDRDGTARRLPLALVADERIWPMLGVETLRLASPGRSLVLVRGQGGMQAAIIAGRRTVTDERGRVWLHFAGPGARPVVPAASVIRGEVDPTLFRGRTVLVGATAAGLEDRKATAVAAAMPGVQLHAELIENLRDGTALQRPAQSLLIELGLIMATVLPLVVWAPRLAALPMLWLGSLVLLGTAAMGGLLFFLGDLLIDVTLPLAAGLVSWGFMVSLHHLREERARRQAAAHLAAMRHEASLAAAMQRAILPQALPAAEGVALHSVMIPALDVGGDFYDAFMLPSGRIALLIADVSGKGMGAALFMAVARTVLRASAGVDGEDCSACLARANDLLALDNAATMFVTVFYAVFDPATGLLAFANGGHNPPYVVAADGPAVALPLTGGPALGMLAGLPYRARQHQLRPGDTLLLYTDGVPEAFAANGEAYGEARMETVLAAVRNQPPPLLVAGLVEAVRTFARGAPQSDDITCLALRFSGEGARHGLGSRHRSEG